MPTLQPTLKDIDVRIWREELDSFVPDRVFDVHVHHYHWELRDSATREADSFGELLGRDFPVADKDALDRWDGAILPGRVVHRLAFGFPFFPAGDLDGANRFAAAQVRDDPVSGALMLVHPTMSPDDVERQIRVFGFLGLKPYPFYSRTGDWNECRITDFLPEEQIAVANRLGLLIMLHLSRRDAIADADNIAELKRLAEKYPNTKWILAHCARSYAPWVIERAIPELQNLPNVWYDVSTVCDSDVMEILLAGVGANRVMYGSDDLPNGASRGKYITFGHAWAFLSETNHALSLTHCSPEMTFVRYEQLRAMCRAAKRLGLDRSEIADLFYNTAARLVRDARDCIAARENS